MLGQHLLGVFTFILFKFDGFVVAGVNSHWARDMLCVFSPHQLPNNIPPWLNFKDKRRRNVTGVHQAS